ncbi:MAG: GNAT family N-acetyltransferase [Candidatus Hydrogenedentes bacterium]|nr:GNAT family N-acetyltransferase [Candidatus Hydrogenedentota bacterium]
MVQVQEATESDLNSLCAIDRLVIGSSERRSFLSSAIASRHCYKAAINGEVLGFMVLEETFYGHAFISFLIVHPGHRREGIASALIEYAESIAPTDKLFTSTNESNVEMQRLCEALGFVRSGNIENLDDEDPEIVYFKQVTRNSDTPSHSNY